MCYVHITAKTIDFKQEGTVLLTAPIDISNTTYLAGQVISTLGSAQFSATSTLPLTPALWHRRFAHFHHAGVQSMAQESLVHGMKLDSKSAPDAICEPCLAGKLNAAPFPLSTHCASQPLELVHSDVHGPLPVRTPSGMRYWVTFIDDNTRNCCTIPMNDYKDETSDEFK